MRVISGTLGGRLFDSPNTFRTHPMSDKARGALFNMLGDIKGMSVLDPFAGTGALSFEAISRGAASAIAIDSDSAAQKAIAANIKHLGLDNRITLVRSLAGAWIYRNQNKYFDLVLCDPPYNDPQFHTLDRLAKRVSPDGLLVLSWPGSEELPTFAGLKRIEQRSHGDIQLAFYRKIS